MFDGLNFIQKIGIFIVPIFLILGGFHAPTSSLRRVCWGMLVFTLMTYILRLF
jgi:hypothetical protein